jgi:hypothetical protein
VQALKVQLNHSEQWRTGGENLGAMSGSIEWDEPFSFHSDDAYERSLRYLRAVNNGLFSVSSMRSTLDVHVDSSKNRKPLDETACDSAAPSEPELTRVLHAQLGCDRLNDGAFARTLTVGVLAGRKVTCDRLVTGAGLRQARAAPVDPH